MPQTVGSQSSYAAAQPAMLTPHPVPSYLAIVSPSIPKQSRLRGP